MDDTQLIDFLESTAQPTMVNGEGCGLAVVVVYHLELNFRQAVEAFAASKRANPES